MPQPWSHLTVICQDVCWTKLTLTTQSGAQEYCNQSFHLHVIGARGTDIFTNSILTTFQLGRADEAEKINSKMFSRECGSSGSPKVVMIWGFFTFYLFAIFSAERRHYTDRANSWMKQQMCQEQDTAWICYPEEDEPQKLHNFLISSLPDTWLYSVVRWATLTSTFCMICKTDFL